MEQKHPLIEILSRWPSRKALADDAGVDLYAVHRWFQRSSVKGEHDAKLLAGAAERGIPLTAEEIVMARSFCGATQAKPNEAA